MSGRGRGSIASRSEEATLDTGCCIGYDSYYDLIRPLSAPFLFRTSGQAGSTMIKSYNGGTIIYMQYSRDW